MADYGSSINPVFFTIVKGLVRIIFPALFDIRILGLENLPENTPFLLFPKHQRWEDIPLLGLVIPRPLYYIAKHELFSNPISSFFISSLGGIPLNRKRPKESLNGIINVFKYLRGGEGIVIFPEGTYYPGSMGPGKTGLLRMIQSYLRFPLIPVGIGYKNKGIRTTALISLGKPVSGEVDEIIRNFSTLVMDEIARLSGFRE